MWKHWPQDAMPPAKDRLKKAQTGYKRNYEARLRRQLEAVRVDDCLYLRLVRKTPKDQRHKLAAVTEGPFLVTNVETNMVIIEEVDRSIEKVSSSRLVKAPRPATDVKVKKIPELLKETEIDLGFSTVDTDNLWDLPGRNAGEGSVEKKCEVDATIHKKR